MFISLPPPIVLPLLALLLRLFLFVLFSPPVLRHVGPVFVGCSNSVLGIEECLLNVLISAHVINICKHPINVNWCCLLPTCMFISIQILLVLSLITLNVDPDLILRSLRRSNRRLSQKVFLNVRILFNVRRRVIHIIIEKVVTLHELVAGRLVGIIDRGGIFYRLLNITASSTCAFLMHVGCSY